MLKLKNIRKLLIAIGVQILLLIVIDSFSMNIDSLEYDFEMFGGDCRVQSALPLRFGIFSLKSNGFPFKHIEFGTNITNVSILKVGEAYRYSFLSVLLTGIAGGYDFFNGPQGTSKIALLILSPQLLSNLHIYIPIVKDRLYLFGGHITDLYIDTGIYPPIYYEGRAGINVRLKHVNGEVYLAKPIVNELTKVKEPTIGFHLGFNP